MKKVIIVVLLHVVASYNILAQIEALTPKSPEAETLISNIEAPVGKYTGTFSYSIPITTISEGDLIVPVSIDYRGASKKVTEKASATGLGWNLSSKAYITRKVNGLPDESVWGFLNARQHPDLSVERIDQEISDRDFDYINNNFLGLYGAFDGCWDTEPDEFYFTIGGVSGKFAFSWNLTEDIVINCPEKVQISFNQGSSFTTNFGEWYESFFFEPIIAWEITDAKGRVYQFNDYETSANIGHSINSDNRCASGNEGSPEDIGHISSWYVSQITSNASPNDNIYFEYIDNGYKTEVTPIESHVTPDGFNTSLSCIQLYGSFFGSNYWTNYEENDLKTHGEIGVKSLRKIYNDYEEISFEYNTIRNDLIPFYSSDHNDYYLPKRLDEIIIKGQGGVIKQKYNFDFYPDNNQKLLLKSVQETDNSQSLKLPPYQFEYLPVVGSGRHPYPKDHPFSVDHWGYPNQSTHDTNLPEIRFENPNVWPHAHQGLYVTEGSEKQPTLAGSSSYILRKIKFPTGGIKEFHYELNTASFVNDKTLSQTNLDLTDYYPFETIDEGDAQTIPLGGGFQNVTFPFSIQRADYDGSNCGAVVDFLFENTTTGNFPNDGSFCFTFTIELLDQNGTVIDTYPYSNDFTESGEPICASKTKNGRACLPTGNYTLRVNIPMNAQYEQIFSFSYNYKEVTDVSKIYIGGVRVKKIFNYEKESVLNNIIKYSYEDTLESNGVIYGVPKYFDKFNNHVWFKNNGIDDIIISNPNCDQLAIGTSNNALFFSSKGSHIGYKKVIEYNSGKLTRNSYASNPVGYTISYFSSPFLYPDQIQYNQPYSHPITQNWKTGNLLKQEAFNENNILIKCVKSEYESKSNFVDYYKIEPGRTRYQHWFIDERNPWGIISNFNTHVWNNVAFSEKVAISNNPLYFGFTNLTKTKTTTYSENGLQPITDIVEYQYDPTYNNIVSQKSWRNLNDAVNFDQDPTEDYTYTTMNYAYESGIGGPGSSEVNAANMVGIPMKITTQYNANDGSSNIVSGSKVDYTAFNRVGIDYIMPFRFYDVKGGAMRKNYELTYDPFPGGLNVSSKREFTSEEKLDDNYTKYIWSNDLVEEVQNHSSLGVQTTHYDYNNLRKLERITDHNGQITEFVYDGLQRLDKVKSGKGTGLIAADGTVIAPAGTGFRKETNYNYFYMLDANGNVIPNAENKIETTVKFPLDGTLEDQKSRIVFDGLGRETRSEKDNFDADATNTVILNEKVYDDFGRLANETNLGSGTVIYAYEDAPLNRILQITTPTSITKSQYGNNAGNGIAVDGKTYLATSLSRLRTIVYDRNNAEESRADSYTDFMGREIMNMNFVEKPTGDLAGVTTKMAYNDLNQLVKILPHLGQHYEYTYNQRGLLASKNIPNKGTMNYWYDKLERQVASDDPAGNIFVIRYDDLGREIATGLRSTPIPWDSDTYNAIGITDQHNSTKYYTDNNNNSIDWVELTRTTNLANGNLLPTLMNDYDDVGRLLKSTTTNHKGGKEINEMTYNDADLVTNSKLTHNASNNIDWNTQLVLEWENTFDDAFRPKEQKFKDLTTNNWQTISQLAYNNNNQVIQKKLHETNSGDWWQKVDYSYDNAGRLKKINEPLDLRCEQNTAELCDKSYNVTPSGNGEILEVFVTDIQYYDRDGVQASIPLAYPYSVNSFTIDGFQNAIGNWLTSNGYIYDHIEVSLEDGKITFEQTNIDLGLLLQSNTPKQVVTGDCCAISNVDLYAQTLVYQGNQIERMDWGVSCGGLQRYNFEYDMMHRLTDATYSDKAIGDGWTESNFYDTRVIYDHIGNIRNFYRNGKVNGGAIRIDNLKYKYTDLNNSSRLMKVEEKSRPEGFEVTSTYSYDLNGNMKGNSGKAMNVFSNHFNLPYRVVKGGTGAGTIDFTYLGNMAKAQKITKQGGTTTTKDYIGSIEYKNGQLEAIYHSDGRFTFDANNNQQYEYTIKDHLGNTRVSFTDVNNDGGINQSDILQENHYYPFGMKMGNNGVTTTGVHNDYQYNGKELNEELGLDWYNYGFRMYDPAIARFTGVDPISDQYAFVSTYNYAENSPIRYIDLHGLQAAEPDGVSPTVVRSVWNEGDQYNNISSSLSSGVSVEVVATKAKPDASERTQALYDGAGDDMAWDEGFARHSNDEINAKRNNEGGNSFVPSLSVSTKKPIKANDIEGHIGNKMVEQVATFSLDKNKGYSASYGVDQIYLKLEPKKGPFLKHKVSFRGGSNGGKAAQVTEMGLMNKSKNSTFKIGQAVSVPVGSNKGSYSAFISYSKKSNSGVTYSVKGAAKFRQTRTVLQSVGGQ